MLLRMMLLSFDQVSQAFPGHVDGVEVELDVIETGRHVRLLWRQDEGIEQALSSSVDLEVVVVLSGWRGRLKIVMGNKGSTRGFEAVARGVHLCLFIRLV